MISQRASVCRRVRSCSLLWSSHRRKLHDHLFPPTRLNLLCCVLTFMQTSQIFPKTVFTCLHDSLVVFVQQCHGLFSAVFWFLFLLIRSVPCLSLYDTFSFLCILGYYSSRVSMWVFHLCVWFGSFVIWCFILVVIICHLCFVFLFLPCDCVN